MTKPVKFLRSILAAWGQLWFAAAFTIGCGSADAIDDTPVASKFEPLHAAGHQRTFDYDPGPGWRLDWADEFNGSSLNPAYWTVLTSNFDPVTNNCNFGTGELEFPRAANVSVSGGVLSLRAQRTGDNPNDTRCTRFGGRAFYSGRIHTKGKVEKRYGKLVARIKVPSGYGMWPAFWTLGSNISSVGWPASGEIDMLEWRSTEPTWMQSAVHWYRDRQQDWGTGASGGYNIADSFHTYEVEWTASSMVFRLDGQYVSDRTYHHNETAFQQPHYILLNLALGGIWYKNPSATSVDLGWGVTKSMDIDWVRWYQPSGPVVPQVQNSSFESGMSSWTTWTPNGTASAAFSETYGGAHSGGYHLTHWSTKPFETWTYQTMSGLPAGSYKIRAWVRKGGSFNFSRLQAKTCPTCTPVYTSLGTYGSFTLVETPSIAVTGGYLEFGFHTQASAASSANFIHMDDVELVRL